MLSKATPLLKYIILLETNLWDTLKIHILIGQIFGACPVNITFITNSHQQKSVFLQRVKKCAHLCWSFLVLASVIAGIFSKYSEIAVQMNAVEKFLTIVEYCYNIINCCIVVVGCNYQRKCYGKYLAALVEIDLKLLRVGVSQHFSNLKVFLRKTSLIFLAFLSILILIILLFNNFDILMSLKVHYIYVVPNIIVYFALLEYLGLLYTVSERYNQITSTLKRISSANLFENNQIKREALEVFFMNPPTWTHLKTNTLLDDSIPIESVLNILRKIHYDLSVLESAINRSFGFMIVTLITLTFIVSSTQLYQLYTYTQGLISVNNIYSAIYNLFFVIFHGFKVFAILFMNSKVSDEVIIIIHSLITIKKTLI